MNLKGRLISSVLTCAVAAMTAVGVVSCAEADEFFRPDVGASGGTAGEVTMSLAVDGMDYRSRTATKAAAHELALNHVHVIFFSSLDNSYITHVSAQVLEGPSGPTFSFSIPSELKQEIEYKTLVVGNGDYFVPLQEDGTSYENYSDYIAAIAPGHTIQEVENALEFYNDQPMSSRGTPFLPMYGELINAAQVGIPFKYVISGDKYIVDGIFYFKRAVSRIDVRSFIPDKLAIDFVKVVNYREGAYAYRDGKNCGASHGLYGSGKPAEGVNGWMAVAPAVKEDGTQVQTLEASLYTFPAVAGATASDDEHTTALLIAGRYGTNTQLTYYRFNLSPVGEPLSLKRNHIYTAILKNITGNGDASEDDAMHRDSPVITAEVSEDWGDDTSVTTDADGNYIILSRTTVTLEGQKDITEIIQVKTNEGTKWRLRLDNQTGNNNDKFEFKEIDPESFYVKTVEENTTYVLRKGFASIVATTPQGNELIAPFIAQQVPNEEDPKYLRVQGGTENFTQAVSGLGGSIAFTVETGSLVEGWTAVECDEEGNPLEKIERDPMTNSFSDETSEGSTYTSNGGHMGHLQLSFSPNITKADRKVFLRVERVNSQVNDTLTIKPIIITFVQEMSKNLVTIYPYPENGTLIIEGFEPLNSLNNHFLGNTISGQEEIFVSLTNPNKYKFEVKSTFDYNRDLRLSKTRMTRDNNIVESHVTHPTQTVAGKTVPLIVDQTGSNRLTGMTHGQKFYINVMQTGPGDPDIEGEITVTAIPDDPDKYKEQSITFHVRIHTSCTIGDAVLDYNGTHKLVVADRNVGAMPRISQTKGFVPALNYSVNPGVHITGQASSAVDTDMNYAQYKGGRWAFSTTQNDYNDSHFFKSSEVSDPEICYTEFTAENLDPDELYSNLYKPGDKNWTIPTDAQWSYIQPHLRWSKRRCFILSQLMDYNDGTEKYIGCYLPITDAQCSRTSSGRFDSEYYMQDSYRPYYGNYMSSTQQNTNYVHYTRIVDEFPFTEAAHTTQRTCYAKASFPWTTPTSVRMVRVTTNAEIDTYKKKFLRYL